MVRQAKLPAALLALQFRAPVHISVASFPIQLPANASVKAAEDGKNCVFPPPKLERFSWNYSILGMTWSSPTFA